MSADAGELVDARLRLDPAAGLPAKLPPRPPGTFEVLACEGSARAGRLWTAHGPVDTPCFMPVGTYGAVKGLAPAELFACGTQMLLANAYHLTHRPGAERVRALGGLHRLMAFDGPILTDSGGYQVFSLRSLQRIDEGGVDYRTHFDGSAHRMTPRSVLSVQAALGSDVCMVLDHCPPADASPVDVQDALARTTRWAREAAAIRPDILGREQLCFGIVQGGVDLELRRRALDEVAGLPFEGLALGGLSVGEPRELTHATLAAIAPHMPEDRPRYVMGIGLPGDLAVAVASGVDLFDCVIPTRHARNGQLFTWGGPVAIRHAQVRDDAAPLDPGCGCPTCRTFTRAYLRHLHEHRDPLYVRLASLHNLVFFHQLVAALRVGLREGRFADALAAVSSALARPHAPPREAGSA